MKILITGATGLIGSEIVRLCYEKGIDVNYLTTRSNKISSQKGYQGFLWNPEKEEIDLKCFEGVSAIINLAGASISKRWTSSYKKEILSSRINTIQTLYKGLHKINTTQITSFISASAIGIYPNSLSKFYSEEDTGVDDSFLGEVVQAWEGALQPLKKFKFKLATIRIGLVMSQEGGALPEMAKPIKYYAGAAFGSGQQWQSWIHITDLAGVFLYAIESQLQGVYNAVGPNPVTNTKLVKEIAKVLNMPIFLPNIPKVVMKLLLGEMSYLLFASHRVSSKKIEKEGFVFEYQNICRALEQIYHPNPVVTAKPSSKDTKELV